MALNDAGDQKSAREIERLILERIPATSKHDGVSIRAGLRRLAIFISQLSETSYEHLMAIVRSRWNTRAALVSIAQFRLNSRKAGVPLSHVERQTTPVHPTFSRKSHGEGPDNNISTATPTIELRNHAFALASLLSARIAAPITLEYCQKYCMSFATAADLKVFEKILKAVHPLSTCVEVADARQDVVSRLGSKTVEGVFFTEHVFPICCTGVFSGSYFAAACDIAKRESFIPSVDCEEDGSMTQMVTESGKRILPGILRFLEIVGTDCSEVLGFKVDEIRSLIDVELGASDSSADVILCGMRQVCRLPAQSCHEAGNDELLAKLKKHMMTDTLIRPDRGGKLSKWGCRAYIHLNKNDSDAIRKLGKDLAAKLDAFTGKVEAIVAPVASLSQLAKHAPTSFKSCALECFDFSRALLSGTMNGVIHSAQDADDENETLTADLQEMKKTLSENHIFGPETGLLAAEMLDRRSLCTAELVQRAVKLLVYTLAFQDDEESIAVIDILMRICDDTQGDVFSIANQTKEETPDDDIEIQSQSETNVVKKDDDEELPKHVLDASPSLKAVFAVCRLYAGRGILYLSRQARFFRKITPHVFISTLLLAQDPSSTVRLSFAKSVFNSILRKRLQLRWSVALALMAVEPVMENLSQARMLLTAIFRRRRRLYNHARQTGKSANLQLLPESAVPELIWVLAHFPGVQIDQEAGFIESQKCLELFLDRLLESNEHAGILNEYIECLSIAQVASDRDDNQGTEYVIELSRIAGGILRKKQSGRKWNLSDYPGRVALPMDMFKTVDSRMKATDVMRPSLVELARKLDDKDVVESTRNTPGNLISDVKASSVPSTGRSKRRRSRVSKSKPDGNEKKLFDRLAKVDDSDMDVDKAEVPEGMKKTKEATPLRSLRGRKRSSEEVDSRQAEANTSTAKQRTGDKERKDGGKEKEITPLRISKRGSRGIKQNSEELDGQLVEYTRLAEEQRAGNMKNVTPVRISKSRSRGRKRGSAEMDDALSDIAELADVQDVADAVDEEEKSEKRRRKVREKLGAAMLSPGEHTKNEIDAVAKNMNGDEEQEDLRESSEKNEDGTNGNARETKGDESDGRVQRVSTRKRGRKGVKSKTSVNRKQAQVVVRRSARNRRL
eukprot:gb/GEZJ01001609.1/.p1 GENE.gb/GEZJ01001609.1/~~gb/GEZJ01001609.1/.p1  ORF type:complete len:1239 (-),score=208.74 gb/GEZJ01001609.1/:1109-4501(-)